MYPPVAPYEKLGLSCEVIKTQFLWSLWTNLHCCVCIILLWWWWIIGRVNCAEKTRLVLVLLSFFLCRIQISQTVLCPIKSVTNSLLQLHQIATGCLQVGKAAWFTDNDQEVHRFAWLEVLCFLEFSLLLKQRVSMSSLSWVWTAPASIIEVRILLWSVFSDRSMLENKLDAKFGWKEMLLCV